MRGVLWFTVLSKDGTVSGCILMEEKCDSEMCKHKEYVEKEGIKMTKLVIEGKNWFIVPVYINRNAWQKEFDKILELTESNTGNEYLIVGDINVRIGEEQELAEEANYCTQNAKLRKTRKSKDKSVNFKGKLILELCESQNLIILNGKTQGDYDGEMTFLGATGSSVKAVANVINFKVETCIFSDHKYIIVSLKTCTEERTELSPKKYLLFF